MHAKYLRAGLEALHEIHLPAFSPQWQRIVGAYSSGRSLYGIGDVEGPWTAPMEGTLHAADLELPPVAGDLELPPVADDLELPELAMAPPPLIGEY